VETRSLSLSDGGNGFLNALKGPLALKLVTHTVTGTHHHRVSVLAVCV
jgi:glycerate kinase